MLIVTTSLQELPLDADLSYFDRGRLEAEYLKMKGLKKKFEQYAIDAKQTAQRVSFHTPLILVETVYCDHLGAHKY